MTSTTRTVIAFITGAAIAAAGMLAAHESGLIGHGERSIARQLQKAAEILPLEEIHAKALAAKPGRIIESDFEIKGARFTYEVDILDEQGVFWEVEINAKTGELVRAQPEHDD